MKPSTHQGRVNPDYGEKNHGFEPMTSHLGSEHPDNYAIQTVGVNIASYNVTIIGLSYIINKDKLIHMHNKF